jgi:hypothetical protein
MLETESRHEERSRTWKEKPKKNTCIKSRSLVEVSVSLFRSTAPSKKSPCSRVSRRVQKKNREKKNRPIYNETDDVHFSTVYVSYANYILVYGTIRMRMLERHHRITVTDSAQNVILVLDGVAALRNEMILYMGGWSSRCRIGFTLNTPRGAILHQKRAVFNSFHQSKIISCHLPFHIPRISLYMSEDDNPTWNEVFFP